MTEKRLCEKCVREFDAEEIWTSQRDEARGIIINDSDFETICPDCKSDLGIEEEDDLID